MAVLCRGGSPWLSWRDASQTIMRGHLARLVAEGAGGAGKGGPSGGMAALGLVLEGHRGDPRDCSLVEHE